MWHDSQWDKFGSRSCARVGDVSIQVMSSWLVAILSAIYHNLDDYEVVLASSHPKSFFLLLSQHKPRILAVAVLLFIIILI